MPLLVPGTDFHQPLTVPASLQASDFSISLPPFSGLAPREKALAGDVRCGWPVRNLHDATSGQSIRRRK